VTQQFRHKFGAAAATNDRSHAISRIARAGVLATVAMLLMVLVVATELGVTP
jgi:hypothetical protein